ncbi:hypothetical protein ACLVWQ_34760 [Streptomyces sp. CWNU-52B]|uniref:hypothetical protein n=1 Tax=unclassified Streptomyces TaxID=2593676 RepID=UPI0039C19BF6
MPAGATTDTGAEPDRTARVHTWTILPGHASVNWHGRPVLLRGERGGARRPAGEGALVRYGAGAS